MRAQLRRVEALAKLSQPEWQEHPIRLPDLVIDPVTCQVWSRGQPVQLTARESKLLWFLASNAGRIFSREYLLERIWGPDFVGTERTIDAHIARIRKKLGGPGSPADRLVAYWGIGYRFQRRESDT